METATARKRRERFDDSEALRALLPRPASPIEADAPAEVRPLLAAVERLSRHQAQRLGRIRHAAGNLSHALKTPLAVLGHSADALAARGDEEGAAAIRTQLETMRATIERELRRARLAGGAAGGAGFALRAQLGALVEVLQRLHAGRGLRIELEADERTWPVDREDMLELFGNLLDNACKWARARVRVVVAPDAGTARLAFSVEDDGPGVAHELLERLGTAGLRADESRPGHGLGLAQVQLTVQEGPLREFARESGTCARVQHGLKHALLDVCGPVNAHLHHILSGIAVRTREEGDHGLIDLPIEIDHRNEIGVAGEWLQGQGGGQALHHGIGLRPAEAQQGDGSHTWGRTQGSDGIRGLHQAFSRSMATNMDGTGTKIRNFAPPA